VYEIKGDAYRRSRVRIDELEVTKKNKKNQKRRLLARVLQQEWLRWMHEATVAEVAETADGPVVLTFETALPYDDTPDARQLAYLDALLEIYVTS